MCSSDLDIQPKKPKPTLELRFEKSDSHLLPRVNKAPVTLMLDGIRWSGTIGITASNPPYLHTNLFANTIKRSMTDLLKSLGVIERGQLEFEIITPGELRFVRVIERGQWREGNDRGERANF